MKRIEEALEKLGYNYKIEKQEDGTWYGLVEFWTDTAGQDIPTEIEFDGTAEDFVKQFCQAAENYDVDEEVSVYVSHLGKSGVPDTVRELLDDCQEAKDTLQEIAKALQNALTGESEDALSLFDNEMLQKAYTIRDLQELTKNCDPDKPIIIEAGGMRYPLTHAFIAGEDPDDGYSRASAGSLVLDLDV